METLLSPSAIHETVLLEALNWRYATKIFDKSKKLDEKQVATLLEALRLAPSSIGLQPWKFILINDKTVRSRIKEYSLDQTQITDASHLLLLCSFNDMNAAHIDRLVSYDKEVCKNDHSAYEDFRPHAIAYIESMPKARLKEWMAEQAYIALGFLLSACAMLRIDACPIEAFDREKTNSFLELDKYGVNCRTLVALGHRSENDRHALDKKVRFKSEDVFLTI